MKDNERVLEYVLMSMPQFLTGIVMTWTSYTEPILLSEESPLGVSMTRSQLSMVASFPLLGSMLAVVTTWRLPDAVGRKNAEILVGVIFTLSWSLIATANSVAQLIVARCIVGFGFGLHFIVFMVYINELVKPFIRGTMACVPFFFYSFGTLVSYLLGWFCSYNSIVYMNLVIAVVYTVVINFIRESPVYLAVRGRDKEALKCLKFYRGNTKMADLLEEIQYFKKLKEETNNVEEKPIVTEETKLNEAKEERGVTERSPLKTLLTSKAPQRALVTVLLMCIQTSLMGPITIMMYAGQIFRIAVPEMSPDMCSVIMAVAIAIGTAISVVITDLMPRRLLMLSTCLICAASQLCLSTLLRWSWAPAWAVPVPVLVFSCAFNAGVGNLPFVQLSESFLPKVKVLASSIFMATMFGSNFTLISLFSPTVDYLGLDVVFFVFFLVTVVGTVLCFFIMKETRNVPVEDVQKMYGRGYLYRE